MPAKNGLAVSFVTPDDRDVYFDLKQCLTESPVSTCPAELRDHPDAANKPGVFVAKRKDEKVVMG